MTLFLINIQVVSFHYRGFAVIIKNLLVLVKVVIENLWSEMSFVGSSLLGCFQTVQLVEFARFQLKQVCLYPGLLLQVRLIYPTFLGSQTNLLLSARHLNPF